MTGPHQTVARRATRFGLTAVLLVAAVAGGRATAPHRPAPPPARPEAVPRLDGRSLVVNSQLRARRGQRFMTGAAASLWTPTRSEVRIRTVEALGSDGMALRDLMLVEEQPDNPGFQGPTVPGGLQAQVDHAAGRGKVRLQPAEGAVLRCCGASYDLYLDSQVTSAASAGHLLGVRLGYVTPDGRRGRVDVVMPVAFCTGGPDEKACRSTARRVDAALTEANR